MRLKMIDLGLLFVVAAGCQTSGPGVHMIPMTRDYARLEKVSVEDAAQLLREAHQRGAESAAPYEYASAAQYLTVARMHGRAGDRQAMRDYAGLSKQMSEAAMERCPEADTAEPVASSETYEACQARFEAGKERYGELDREKAVLCAPVVYAHLTATLSVAEHALKYRPGWRQADLMLETAEADIEAIRRQDTDADGTPDLNDAEPWLPEDIDGHSDTDGAPDLDNDRDGVPDKTDVQPLEPETVNGYKDHDGAPDSLPVLDAVLFEAGSSELSGEARGYLRGVKTLLAEWPRLRLRVSGHGNPTSVEADSVDLSRVRAENVRRYLLEQAVSENQLVVTFYGAAQTVADAGTAAGRAQNARVELQLE